MLDKKLERKLEKLRSALMEAAGDKRVAVAFSGGVDSSVLVKLSRDVLGDSVYAVTVDSDFFPRRDLANAKETAAGIGVRHKVLRMELLSDENFRVSYPMRCYYCKKKMIRIIKEFAKQEGFQVLFDASNLDDLKEGVEGRPGVKALREEGVESPLALAGISKEDVREIARELGITTADRPSNTCLATRIPIGGEITKERLSRIEEAEDFLHDIGVGWLRVRDHGEIAIIEVSPADRELIFGSGEAIKKKLLGLGYVRVSLGI